MIIGHGDVASALKEADSEELLFFASGVSNSRETDEAQYKREYDLLFKQPKDTHLVYFSSLCIFYSNTRYARHKKLMEDKVKYWFNKYTIIRLGNITWGDNPHTIINYFRNAIHNNWEVQLEDSYRYLIGKDEFLHWIKMIPPFSCEMNLPGKRMKVKHIYEALKYSNGKIYEYT